MVSTRRESLAWAAGVFEAKGHVRRRRRGEIVARMTDTNRDLLEDFRAIVGMGSIHALAGGPLAKLQSYRFETGARLLPLLEPHFTDSGRARIIT